MRQPDSLIIKLLPVNRHATSAISNGSITTLHHESLDNSVEFVALVGGNIFFFSGTEGAEIFSCDRYLVSEKLENDATLLEFGGVFFANGDVEVGLGVGGVELGQHVGLWVSLGGFVFVDAGAEEAAEGGLLFLFVIIKSLLTHLPMRSQHLVLQIMLDSILHIFLSIFKPVQLQVCLRPEKERFHSLGLDCECLSAHGHGLRKGFLLHADVGNVLHEDDFESFDFLAFILDSRKVGKRVAVALFCFLELAGLELCVSRGFELLCGTDQLFVRLHPLGRSPVVAHEQLYGKDESRISGDLISEASRPVSEGGADSELGFFAKFHAHDADVPAADHLPSADRKLDRLFVVTSVERRAVCQSSLIVDEDVLALDGRCSIAISFYD
jgi:hypothetical protein